MEKRRITTPENLDAVHDLIHDYSFWVDDVVFNDVARTVQVKFQRPSSQAAEEASKRLMFWRVRAPLMEWILEIASVQSYELKESEGIGRYCFNVLKYSEHDRKLIVTTDVPLLFNLTVDGLDILVRETEKQG